MTSTSIKPETITEEAEDADKSDEEEEEEDDGANPEVRLVRQQIKFLSRLSADIILKSNMMVAFTIQKSPTLWILPPALRSLLYSLVSWLYFPRCLDSF